MEQKNSTPSGTPFLARRLLIREPHQAAEDERHSNECVALKALRLSRGNLTCKILTVVKAGPRRANLGFGEIHFRLKLGYSGATIWIALRATRTLPSVFRRTKPPGPEFS